MPDPRVAFLATLQGATSFYIYADDGVTKLQYAKNGMGDFNGNLNIVKHPYLQAGSDPNPVIVIGPLLNTNEQMIAIPPKYWPHAILEITCVARDWDNTNMGFTLDGDKARNKLVEAIESYVKTNQLNIDGTGAFVFCMIKNRGVDEDDLKAAPQVFRTHMQLEFQWFE